MPKARKQVIQDLSLVLISILAAILLKETHWVNLFIDRLHEWEYLGNFLAGTLFTSVFTTAPAITILGELAERHSVWSVALFGGLGAMVGDLVLFQFVRNRASEDVKYLLGHSKTRRLSAIFRTKLFHWFVPFLGAVIIASPLPDEIGLTILGLSKISYGTFLSLSFTLNALGILIIGLIAISIPG